MINWLLVFAGGGAGSICRFAIAQWMAPLQLHFPWATWVANILSCIFLGLLTGWSLANRLTAPYQYLLMTGFCGGFSTFSTFTNESFRLMSNGQAGTALLYMGLSMVSCLLALYLGIKISSSLT